MDVENLELDVTISLEDYATLRNAAKVLEALEDAGVAHWEGYEPTMEEVRKVL